ncbi:hypothetical protein ScFU53_12250 [Streptococcus canis]|uniref:DUF975 family protein n=1 Tax=Streptococcus canis TaxID=1329 RepID=UPI001387E86C|nr:DUF975 family protein [Streptococcus canis]GFG44213.1 hypothetical protein ScFU53_12250 [Streptococcus canis]GFG45246.1 hypothetical protein ScFU93_04920 [Streptococcus canis]
MSIKEIKRQAKTTLASLSGKYLLFLIPTLLVIFHFGIEVHQGYILAYGIEISLMASYFPLLLTLIISFFTLSAAFTMIDVARHYRRKVTFSESTTAFSGELFGKLLILFFMKWLFFLVWSLIWFLGLFIFIIGLSAFMMNAKSGTGIAISLVFLVLGALLTLVGFGIYVNRYYAYSLAEYILYDKVKEGAYLGSVAAIETSVAMMKGYKWKLFLLQLSFIGWFLLNLLTLGLLTIYLLPYFTTANVIFYDRLKKRYEENDEPLEGEHLRIPKLNKQPKPLMCDDHQD